MNASALPISADDEVGGARGKGLGRGRDTFLVVGLGTCGTDAGGDDQLAFGFGQGADHRGFVGGGDDSVSAGSEGGGGAGGDNLGHIAGADLRRIQIIAVIGVLKLEV